TNGLVERANRSLSEGIKERLEERSKNWMEELPHVLWAHRTMIKSSNGDTPFSLTYGMKAVIPAEIGMPTLRTAEVDLIQNNEALEINLDLLEERGEEAAIREAKSKAKMEKYYNTKAPSGKDRTSLIHAPRRRSSVLDDLGSGGPMRGIWQKADLCSQGSSLSEHKSEFVSSALSLLLSSEPERKASKAIVENGKTSMRNSGYAFVPTQSTQMASKILEYLERTSPKEKNSSSRLDGTTEKSDNKLWHMENGPQRSAIPLIVLSSMNGNSTARVKGNAPTTNAASILALPVESRQKKPTFQMSVHEYFEVLDDDNHSTARVQDPTKKCHLLAHGFRKIISYDISKEKPMSNKELESKVEDMVEEVKTKMGELFGTYKERFDFLSSNSSMGEHMESEVTSPNNGDNDFLNDYYNVDATSSYETETELDRYLREPKIELRKGQSLDILQWWKVNGPRFPIVSKMARAVFSMGGRVLDPYRTRLSTTIVEALICTQDWVRKSRTQINWVDVEDLIKDDEIVKDMEEQLEKLTERDKAKQTGEI
ncbi:reverse transcriptase domain-containing protein, partial [Tanacetum coccineum]